MMCLFLFSLKLHIKRNSPLRLFLFFAAFYLLRYLAQTQAYPPFHSMRTHS